MTEEHNSATPGGPEPTARELRSARRRAHEEEKKRRGSSGGGKNDKKKGGSQGPTSDERARR